MRWGGHQPWLGGGTLIWAVPVFGLTHGHHLSPLFPQQQLVGQENKEQGRKLDLENKLGFLY